MELWERFTAQARRAVLLAHEETQRAGATLITGLHLLLGLLRVAEGPAHDLLTATGGDLAALVRELRASQPPGGVQTGEEISFAPEAQRALLRAYEAAKAAQCYHVGTEHVLAGLWREDAAVRDFLGAHGLTADFAGETVTTPAPAPRVAPGPVPPSGHFDPVFHVPGRYVNDHCLLKHAGQWHLFYIDGEVGKGCYDLGNETVIGHAVSPDLRQWQALEPALVHDPALAWEVRGIFAPYVLAHDGRFWLYYASHNLPGAQYLCLATSSDLRHWERHPANPLFVPSRQWADWDENAPTSCRDAHILPHEDYGFIMYWVADLRDRRDHSCIAASVSRDLVHWQERGPVLIRSHSNLEAFTSKTESPCVVRRGDRYFLFYRHGNGTKFAVSDQPLDFLGRDSFLFSSAHAAEVFADGDDWYVTNCSRPPEDLAHTEDRRHGLWLGRMHWENDWPALD